MGYGEGEEEGREGGREEGEGIRGKGGAGRERGFEYSMSFFIWKHTIPECPTHVRGTQVDNAGTIHRPCRSSGSRRQEGGECQWTYAGPLGLTKGFHKY